jgi:glycosyltransferase involved in cell wall biosynthesis
MYYCRATVVGVEDRDRLVIGGWLADPDGCGYYRMRLPLDELERRGHLVEYRGTLPWRPGQRPSSHVLIGQRVSNEGPTTAWVGAAGQVRRVFEIDDDLLHIDPASVSASAFYADPARRERLLAAMRSADAVTVSTPHLGRVVREQYGVQVPIHVLPNCVDRAVFELPSVAQDGPVSIGWAGSDTHAGDVAHVRGALRRFMDRHDGFDFVSMGADYRGELGAPWGGHVPWASIWDDPVAYMRRLDWQIGLAPLAPTQFNRCKSALKALEYGARGIVVVASDVEPYRQFVRHGETGFLVSRDHEWSTYLGMLVGDAQLRARMGAAAREQARAWTIDQHIHLWEDAYRGSA